MSVLKAILFVFTMVIILISSGFAIYYQKSSPIQYQIKAAFLYNFTQFVEWPETSFQDPGAPLVIGIMGEDPFGLYLDEMVAGEELNGHPLIVQRFKPGDEISHCHILFVNSPNKEATGKILERIKGQSTLTVSDRPDFLLNGGIIKFITVKNKIKFQINPEASKSADIKISSKLLQLAEIVTPNI